MYALKTDDTRLGSDEFEAGSEAVHEALVEKVHDEPSVFDYVVTARRACATVGIGSGASRVNHQPAGAQHAAMLAGEELEHAVMPSGRECLSGNERRGRCHTCRDWRRTWRPSAPSVW